MWADLCPVRLDKVSQVITVDQSCWAILFASYSDLGYFFILQF